MKLLGDLKESATEKSEEDRGSGTDDRQHKIVASEQLMVENEDIVRLPDSADENSEEVLVLSDRPCEVLASSEVQESCTFKLTPEQLLMVAFNRHHFRKPCFSMLHRFASGFSTRPGW
jgi:hypothetical protein